MRGTTVEVKVLRQARRARRRYAHTLTHRTMVERIVATVEGGTVAQRDAGTMWYERFGRIADLLAVRNGVSREDAVAVLAILSPRVSVAHSVVLSDRALAAWVDGGGDAVRALPGLGERLDAAARWLEGDERPLALDADGRLSTSRKVRSFARNIAGDLDAVTVDVWAARVAGFRGEQPSGGAYVAIAAAYRTAADRLGVSPRECQAMAWCAVRSDVDAAGEADALLALLAA